MKNSKLYMRCRWAKDNLKRAKPQYAIAWEDPADPDAPVKITRPSPEWLAMALHGYLLPPVEVYSQLEHDEKGKIVNGHILHDTPPIGPMTEEEAMGYLVVKDTPARVWNSQSNRRMMVICRNEMIPQNRVVRNAMRLAP